MTPRERLPNRRSAETFDIEVAGLKYTCTVGRFPDGTVGEVFLQNHKPGSQSDSNARDAAAMNARARRPEASLAMRPDRLTCELCGRRYRPTRIDSKYCSNACRQRAHYRRHRLTAPLTAPASAVLTDNAPEKMPAKARKIARGCGLDDHAAVEAWNDFKAQHYPQEPLAPTWPGHWAMHLRGRTG
jgi:hypothetical protein